MQFTPAEYGTILYALANAAGTLVWFAFLQLTLSSVMKKTRPRLLISLGSGRGFDTAISVANQSESIVNFSACLIRVWYASGEVVEHATNILNLLPGGEDAPEASGAYGLLRHGQAVTLVPLSAHVALPSESGRGEPDAIQRVDVCVVANHGVDMTLVGAETSIIVEMAGNRGPESRAIRTVYQRGTRQRRGWWHRRQLRCILERAET